MKGGRKARGRKGTLAAAMATAAKDAPIASERCAKARRSSLSWPAFSNRTSAPSPARMRRMPGSSRAQSAGVTVTATSREQRMETM